MGPKVEMLCGMKLRTLCLVIGVFQLMSSVVDITSHLLVVGVVTNGFQCDVDASLLKKVTNFYYLEPFLLIMNLGTHGFYPFPHIIKNQYNTYVEYMGVSSSPTCYPGVLHVYVYDVLNYLINLIWLKFVIGYVKALIKRDHESMKMFISLSIVKLVMQVLHLGYYPVFFDGLIDVQAYWLLKILDIVIAFYILMVIRKYASVLKAENEAAKKVEKPPSYFESLIEITQPVVVEVERRPDSAISIVESKEPVVPTIP